MSNPDLELQRPTPPDYEGWQGAIARYFKFDVYQKRAGCLKALSL
jgi:hypothetical protein